ncbi:MAG TPA: isoaspartyl peptidase/L-asparaginase, partial [Burkholderiaceae bacterium]
MNATPVIAIHGGAGTISAAALSPDAARDYHAALHATVQAAQALLLAGGAALDAVCLAVRMLEDCPLFNAGRGAVFTHAGTHELDAAVMDGANLRAGAVAGVAHVRNPVLAARAVLEDGAHVLLAGTGAEAFARERGLALVDAAY